MGIMYKLMKHRHLSTDLSNTHTNVNVKSDRNRLITIEGNIIESAESVSEDSSEEVLNNNNNNMDSNLDKQFTAEHIIQLCKFLAEKSKRNKNLYKQQQSPKKLTKSKQTQFQFQTMEEYNDNEDDEVDFYQNEALPLLNKQRMEHQQQQQTQQRNHTDEEDDEFDEEKTSTVLSTRLSPDINSLNISSNTTTSCALQHHQQQQIFNYQHYQQQQQQHNQHQPQNQGKRDILLKIRRQIFERKRLRENGAFEPQALNNSQVWRPW
ncbi:probable serine/threonine-protein kinase DDB_G0280133 [Lucilia cuprina]|uniref:probable serine/threonine-protein kinase DDB_G0280133 n=1 Tax=Lucilia cuprina TaxID=7375 RepID=UPI001F067858|nr:probable serine/threonine-protein kinase DDB_G0280133 [Lucilia cuprina]